MWPSSSSSSCSSAIWTSVVVVFSLVKRNRILNYNGSLDRVHLRNALVGSTKSGTRHPTFQRAVISSLFLISLTWCFYGHPFAFHILICSFHGFYNQKHIDHNFFFHFASILRSICDILLVLFLCVCGNLNSHVWKRAKIVIWPITRLWCVQVVTSNNNKRIVFSRSLSLSLAHFHQSNHHLIIFQAADYFIQCATSERYILIKFNLIRNVIMMMFNMW